MPIQNASDSQKVDFLWKKIVYGAAKTDIAGNIDATQEPYASPLLIRGDRIWQDSVNIPTVIPGSNSAPVTVYTTSLPVECTSAAGIPTPTLTWITGRTNWIPPEFGSTYQVKVYISPSGQAGNVSTKGTQVFATGTGNNDLWVFDYQSGILNFNSNNTPYSGASPISFTGNSVYISGAVYSGNLGLPTASNIGNAILGYFSFNGNTISSIETNGNIVLDPPGSGTVLFAGTSAVGLPSGDDSTRPTYPEIGYTRYNTSRQSIEYYDGNTWLAPGAATISSEVINPDGSANTYTLGSNTTVDSVLVSINGTLQQPIYSYNIVNNNQITFTETPLTSDVIEVRFIAVSATSVSSLRYGPVTAVALDLANVNVTGNLLPSANVTYDLGSPTLRWRTGYFSANTIDIGGGTIGLHDTLGFTFTTPGGEPQYMMPNGASTSNTFTSGTVTIQGNLAVAGNATVTGNVSGQYILGSAQFLTGLPVGYSNVNTKAYTESMGFANYSNVNVAAYTQTQSFTNYSNVNVAAFVTTNGLTNYSNVNVAAYTQTQSFTNYSNVNLSAYLGGAVTIGGNLTVNGNLFINGNLTTINANNLNINDSLIFLADFNPANTLDIGIVSSFTDAVRYQHTGFVRDATDGTWKLFANVVPEPTTTVDFTNANYSTLQVGNINVLGASGGLVNSTGNILSTGLSVFGNTRIGSLATPGALHTIIGNVDISGAGTEYVNIGGNIMAIQGSFGSINVNGNISGNTAGFSIGYRDLPQIIASNVTLALSDASEHFYANTGAPTTITVPSNANVAFPIGTTIVIVNRGAGNVTIQNQGAGAPFLYLAGNAITTTSRTLTQYGMATLLKTETNLWFVNGTGVV